MELWGELSFSDPLFLALIPVGLVAVIVGLNKRRKVAALVPRLPDSLPTSAAQRLAWVPLAMKFIAVLLAVLAMARPLRGNIEHSSTSEGVDIALLLDRSTSMEAREAPQAPSRFDVAKVVLADFATRRMTDNEGAADNVALFGFAGYTQLLVPFTLDADAFRGVMETLEPERQRDLGGTGIGIAIARAVQTFRDLDSDSRIIVLLTDGENNIDTISPAAAGQMAAEEGIRVYTIFVGPRVARYPNGRIQRIQTGQLEEVGELTKAKFFHAETAAELEDVYQEIESLERRPREESRFAEHFDLYPLMLLPSLILYALAWLSMCTWARRMP